MEEALHVPGIGIKFNDNTSFLAEYAAWPRHSREGTRTSIRASTSPGWVTSSLGSLMVTSHVAPRHSLRRHMPFKSNAFAQHHCGAAQASNKH
ncbi:MAG TPA: hypothetical protein VGJ91_05215 [Polyangiaceae bacterium]